MRTSDVSDKSAQKFREFVSLPQHFTSDIKGRDRHHTLPPSELDRKDFRLGLGQPLVVVVTLFRRIRQAKRPLCQSIINCRTSADGAHPPSSNHNYLASLRASSSGSAHSRFVRQLEIDHRIGRVSSIMNCAFQVFIERLTGSTDQTAAQQSMTQMAAPLNLGCLSCSTACSSVLRVALCD